MAHLVGHEKLHDALSITISHYADKYVIILKHFVTDFCMILTVHIFSLMVGQDGQPLWKMVGHLATLHGKRPMHGQ